MVGVRRKLEKARLRGALLLMIPGFPAILGFIPGYFIGKLPVFKDISRAVFITISLVLWVPSAFLIFRAAFGIGSGFHLVNITELTIAAICLATSGLFLGSFFSSQEKDKTYFFIVYFLMMAFSWLMGLVIGYAVYAIAIYLDKLLENAWFGFIGF